MGEVNAPLPPRYKKLSKEKGEDNAACKGYIPVLVGVEEAIEKILLPTKLIRHPYIVDLLDISAREFGYEHQGTLRICFDAGSFKLMVDKLSKNK